MIIKWNILTFLPVLVDTVKMTHMHFWLTDTTVILAIFK